ncbi:MAG: hypothetical protein IJF94_05735 [Eubacterium sp.]|nr:hypothetical protein [Eubacterium sp.]
MGSIFEGREPYKARYEIADLKIVMTTYYEHTKQYAEKYLAKGDWTEDEADEVINLTREQYDIQAEEISGTYENAEYMLTGALFNRMLLVHNGCMLHSSAVAVDGFAYLFSADSGTGKSTHTRLWVEHFGNRAQIINDDKPALRKIDGTWYAFGTPWSGKTDQSVNDKFELGAIVFLERSETNWIEREDFKDAIPKFFRQTVRKLNFEKNMDLVLSNMEEVLRDTPIFKMGCNISDEAVVTAYERIRRK